jgi:hypothetical protein
MFSSRRGATLPPFDLHADHTRNTMPGLKELTHNSRSLACASGRSVVVFLQDVVNGMLEVSHNTLALVGLMAVAASMLLGGRPELRATIETEALGWLKARHEARLEQANGVPAEWREPDAVSRATAIDPRELTRQQAAVAQWLARRYKVAVEPMGRLVSEAWSVGRSTGLDPTLILAIMAIESSFNPFAQSSMGAQGLMQVMTHIHDAKYEQFGGTLAAFDPVTNLRVGVQVLKECIVRAGSVEAGLRHYVGAANLADDSGYAGKVLAEQAHLQAVAGGRMVALNAPNAPAASVAAPAPAAPQTDEGVPADGTEPSPNGEKVALLR